MATSARPAMMSAAVLSLFVLVIVSMPGSVQAQAPGNGTEEVAIVVASLSSAQANYSTLLSLLSNPTYAEALNLTDGENKTVFAPSNAAFAALPANVQAQLSNTTFVTQILQYHVVPLYLPGASILNAVAGKNTSVPTLQGSDILVELANGNLLVNEITVEYPDIVATGVTAVHGINGVLTPPPAEEEEEESSASRLMAASSLSVGLILAAAAALW